MAVAFQNTLNGNAESRSKHTMHFTVEAQRMAKECLTDGAIAIDATVGNGFDTLFLAQHVGEAGLVYGVDIQSAAIESAKQKLQQADLLHRTQLAVMSHADLPDLLLPQDHGQVSVAMFNLGYLPFGDKSIVTTAAATRRALDHTFRLLKLGGLLSVLAYPGHAGGAEETAMIAQWLDDQHSFFEVKRFQDSQNTNSPILWSMSKCRPHLQ